MVDASRMIVAKLNTETKVVSSFTPIKKQGDLAVPAFHIGKGEVKEKFVAIFIHIMFPKGV